MASVTFVAPVYHVTGTLNASNEILAAAGGFSPGTHTATAALTQNSEVLAAVVAHTLPTRVVEAALAQSSEVLTSLIVFSPGTHTATASLAMSPEALASSVVFTIYIHCGGPAGVTPISLQAVTQDQILLMTGLGVQDVSGNQIQGATRITPQTEDDA